MVVIAIFASAFTVSIFLADVMCLIITVNMIVTSVDMLLKFMNFSVYVASTAQGEVSLRGRTS